jgi:hypothetical protein
MNVRPDAVLTVKGWGWGEESVEPELAQSGKVRGSTREK